MLGITTVFDKETGEGAIRNEEGYNYFFNLEDFKEGENMKEGLIVEFKPLRKANVNMAENIVVYTP